MKKNVRLYSEQNRHWWSNEKNTRWAIKDKEGIWWLVGGSEFPKKKTGEKKMQCGLPPTFDLKKIMWRIALGGFIGVALGFIIGFMILSI